MNLMRELDRMTQPTAAGRVRSLSAEEIADLEHAGRITPPERITRKGCSTRVSVPRHRRAW
jgi:hypothetical protein